MSGVEFGTQCSNVGEDLPLTRPGISVRLLTPPKAVPRQVLPVTNWKLRVANIVRTGKYPQRTPPTVEY